MMDQYFPKTRRLSSLQSSKLKKDAPLLKTPEQPIPNRSLPPPAPRKRPRLEQIFESAHKKVAVERKLFDSSSKIRPLINNNDLTSTKTLSKPKVQLSLPKLTPLDKTQLEEAKNDTKITTGPLKGVSSSLLDIIRAKEASAKKTNPEHEREKELLGLAPEVVRIVLTVLTTSKKDYLLHDKIVDKCFNGLKSNYTSSTIIECLDLMSKVAPDWITTVTISRGKFVRLNRSKYALPQLLEAISNYKRTTFFTQPNS